MVVFAIILLGISSAIYGCDYAKTKLNTSSRIAVSASEFGDRWPLTLPQGHIYSRKYPQGWIAVIFVAPNGQEFGLNGAAQSLGWPDVHAITLYTNQPPLGTKQYKDVSELIQIGLNKRKH